MQKLLLIIFVFIAHVSFGQGLVSIDGIHKPSAASSGTSFNGGSTVWRVDSTVLLLKKRIDANDSLYIVAIKRLSQCNCRKNRLKK